MFDIQKPLDTIVDSTTFNIIIRKVTSTRKDVGDGRTFSYEEITQDMDDKRIKVLGRHYALENVLNCANNNCKDCWGKGYYFVNILKSQYPDPNPYLIDESTLPKDLSEKEQKRWNEEEKDKPFSRIMKICTCAVKKAHKLNNLLLSNAEHNIWMTLDYEIVEIPEEELAAKEKEKPSEA